MLETFAKKIMQKTVADYDRIAVHFASTRQQPWPEFQELKKYLKPGYQVLDVGCGNGRLAEIVQKNNCYIGVDTAKKLLAIARQRYPQCQFINASMLQLPFPDNSFDLVCAIASLQHIPSAAYRQQALQEMARVCRPGGILFMTNWNLAQAKYQRYRAPQVEGYDDSDWLIPWKNDRGEILAQRYYHGFSLDEIDRLLKKTHWKIKLNQLTYKQYNSMTVATRQP